MAKFWHSTLPLLVSLAASPWLAADASAKPNIVFIMADDLGYTDVGCFGSRYYETPHIDRLAAQGMKLSNYHHCQNCTPTRAALMSGQYAARTGIYTVGGIERFDWSQRPLRPVDNVTQLPLDRDTIAKQLKAAGYATGMFGKWHIGQQGEYHPGRRGFDEAIVSMGQHFDFATSPKTEYPEGTVPGRLSDRQGRRFHPAAQGAAVLPVPAAFRCSFAVPGEVRSDCEVSGEARCRRPQQPDVCRDDRLGRRQRRPHHADARGAEAGGQYRADLHERQRRRRRVCPRRAQTIGGRDRQRSAPQRQGEPLRRGDAGPIHRPLAWRRAAGTTCDVPRIHVDIFPTLLELAGAPQPRQVLDGESLVKLFRDRPRSSSGTPSFSTFPVISGAGPTPGGRRPSSLIQSGDWKLMEFLEDGRLELYNLRDDIGETKNLAAEMPEKAKELHERLVAWRAEVKAPLPTKNDGAGAPHQGQSEGQG